MKKRLICILLISFTLSFTIIPVYAEDNNSVIDPASDNYNFFFDIMHNWQNKYDNRPESSSEFVSWFMDGVNSNSVNSHIYDYYSNLARLGLFSGCARELDGARESRYRVGIVNEEILERLRSDLTSVSDGNIIFTELGDYSLTTTCSIQESISVVGGSTSLYDGGTYGAMPITSALYDFSNVSIGSGQIALYRGGQLPPCIYIPNGSIVMQDEITLTNGFYCIIGNNELLKLPKYLPNNYVGAYFYIPSNGTMENLELKYGAYSSLTDDGELDPHGRTSGFDYFRSGTKIVSINSSSTPSALTISYAWRSASNDVIKITENPVVDEPPIPANVPYSDDGTVIVMIPTDNNYNIVMGDIRYMSPDEYNQYINDGTIIQGDYVNNYSDDDITNIYNFYTNNTTNNNSSNTTTTTYDDSNIINRLDTIIRKLDTIIDNIGDKAEQINVIFNSQPVYTEFSQCITDNLPIVEDIKESIDIDINGSHSAFDNIATPVNNGSILENVYSNLTLSLTGLSWYEPYRITIRNILKIPVIIMGIGSIWLAIRSVFGVQTGGGGSDD